MKADHYYKGRRDKPQWVVQHFPEQFVASSVADIGCDKKQLKAFLAEGVHYVGIDIHQDADVAFDLDSGRALPIGNEEFDLVVGLDVLEHLEQIHFVLDEMCRISSNHVLISLPNNLQSVVSGYILGRRQRDIDDPLHNGTRAKFYGLPLEKPFDRHRWFFDAEDAEQFIRYRGEKNGFELERVVYEIDFSPFIKKIAKMLLTGFRKRKTLSFFSGTMFFVLKKKQPHSKLR